MAAGRTLGLLVAALALAGGHVQGAMATCRLGTGPKRLAARPGGPARGKLPTGYVAEAKIAPVIDGKLDDEAWRNAARMTLARALDGAGPAAQLTEVRAVQDGTALYLALRCVEPALDKLRAARRSHDGEIWADDSVEVFLGFGGTYYHFGVSAAGSTYDGKGKDPAWSSGLRAAVAKGEKEWTAELALPLDRMLGGAKCPAEWIANFNRSRYAGGELQETAWSPTYSGNSHAPEWFGKLLFSAPPTEPPSAPAGAAETVTVLPTKAGVCVVRFDLSALRRGVRIYRADLRLARTQAVTGADDEAMVDIQICPLLTELAPGGDPAPAGEPLKVRAPWFDSFDATEAVRAWAGGKPNGGFYIKAGPFLDPAASCLDVACEGTPADVPRQVTAVRAFHRAGQTFIIWKETDDPIGTDRVKWGQFRSALDAAESSGLRYCVYRSDKPITAASLHEAERIAVVAPLSGWNVNGRSLDKAIDDALSSEQTLFYGQWNPFVQASMDGKFGLDCAMERLVIRDGEQPLTRGTGLYVHTPGKPGTAFYAVVTCRDGVENTTDLSEGNSLATAVEETAGTGEPVLQKEFPPKPFFNYRERRLHYVRWVAPPYGPLPSQYHNWGVGVPETEGKTAMPIELSLHRDGRSYHRTQYRVELDSLVLSPHDFPVKTWWYGHHESLGTLKSFRQGTVQPYTERRLLAFLDWASRKWRADRSRVIVTGAGGAAAGSGALHLGIRHPKVFSLVLSGYGMADYAGEMAALTAVKRAGTMPVQLEAIWGKVAWGCKTDAGRSVWDELNLAKLVAELPENVSLPLVTVTGGGMLKPMRDFFVAMLERGQPIMGRYGVYGGGLLLPVSRTGTWTNMIRQDVRLDQALPAFSGPGAAGLWQEPREPSGALVVSDGIRRWWGDIHTGCRWKTDDLVDEPVRFEITLFWVGAARERTLADVTLRRLQKFLIRPGHDYRFEVRRHTGELIREGTVQPGKGGQFLLKGVLLTPEGTRVVLRP
ncbi:MAG TPA: sugar-binding protein [Planctomycetota bacterium]|nr:sugar-binding protein [Planctomycetota bacterium]